MRVPRALCACVSACLLLASAGAAPPGPLGAPLRCITDASGDLIGREVRLEDVVLQPGRRVYVQNLSKPLGCEVNGVSARACDVFAPELDVAEGLAQAQVRRLGPRHHPISFAVTYYCDYNEEY